MKTLQRATRPAMGRFLGGYVHHAGPTQRIEMRQTAISHGGESTAGWEKGRRRGSRHAQRACQHRRTPGRGRTSSVNSAHGTVDSWQTVTPAHRQPLHHTGRAVGEHRPQLGPPRPHAIEGPLAMGADSQVAAAYGPPDNGAPFSS